MGRMGSALACVLGVHERSLSKLAFYYLKKKKKKGFLCYFSQLTNFFIGDDGLVAQSSPLMMGL